MRTMSEVWERASQQILAPEGLIKLTCHATNGDTFTYTKNDLLRFSHRQTGDLVSGELPKNYIEFTLDNSDGRWNPGNPSGMERHLSERLKIVLKYGILVDGQEHWMTGGTFYLAEWRTSYNGIEASFVARDPLEFLLDKPYTGSISGSYLDVVNRAKQESELPIDWMQKPSGTLAKRYFFEKNADGTVSTEELENEGNLSCAEIIQKCCNAAGCVMYTDQSGLLVEAPLSYTNTGYTIPLQFSYSHPEFDLARPMKYVKVTYRDEQSILYPYLDTGETQTLDNDFIRTREEAIQVAKWVCDSLRSRKKISGEFRGDPRFELYDVVNVEGKYSTITGVVLTDIEISFSGAFRVNYSGYIYGSGEPSIVYCGEKFTGEV